MSIRICYVLSSDFKVFLFELGIPNMDSVTIYHTTVYYMKLHVVHSRTFFALLFYVTALNLQPRQDPALRWTSDLPLNADTQWTSCCVVGGY